MRSMKNPTFLVYIYNVILYPRIYSRRRVQAPEDNFVHAEHNCCAGYCAQKVRRQAAVHGCHALFLPNELEALDQASVLWLSTSKCGGLAKTCADNLWSC